MQIKRVGRIEVFGILLCSALLLGCGFRAISDRDVAGTYEANAQWGKSTLILHPDHTFEQRVLRDDHTQARTEGRWDLTLYAGRSASHGLMTFKPFLAVAHDQKGVPVPLDLPSVSRGFLWGITIAADPDWGISFDKE
jgi:hypothetical protein